MGYAAAVAVDMIVSEERARACPGGWYDVRTKTWHCPREVLTVTPSLPEPKYRPVSTCPGCGAPMKLGAQVCAYCRRPHGS